MKVVCFVHILHMYTTTIFGWKSPKHGVCERYIEEVAEAKTE